MEKQWNLMSLLGIPSRLEKNWKKTGKKLETTFLEPS